MQAEQLEMGPENMLQLLDAVQHSQAQTEAEAAATNPMKMVAMRMTLKFISKGVTDYRSKELVIGMNFLIRFPITFNA